MYNISVGIYNCAYSQENQHNNVKVLLIRKFLLLKYF